MHARHQEQAIAASPAKQPVSHAFGGAAVPRQKLQTSREPERPARTDAPAAAADSLINGALRQDIANILTMVGCSP